VVAEHGELIRELAIDPRRGDQPPETPAAGPNAATMT
jgi:hypothetical protein